MGGMPLRLVLGQISRLTRIIAPLAGKRVVSPGMALFIMWQSSTGRHPVTGKHARQEADIVRAALSMVMRKKRGQQPNHVGEILADGVDARMAVESAEAKDIASRRQRERQRVRPFVLEDFENFEDSNPEPQIQVRSSSTVTDVTDASLERRRRHSSSSASRSGRKSGRSRLDGAQQHENARGNAPATHWEHTRAAFGDGLRSFRRFALFLTAIAAVLMVAFFLGRQLIHEQIRKALVERLNTHYADAGLRFEIGAVRFQEKSGFHISGLRVVNLETSSRNTSNDVLVSIERVVVHAKTTLLDLLQNNVKAELIEIDGMRAYAHRDASGQWNVAKLFPFPSVSDCPAPLRLTNGQVVIEAEGAGQLRKPLRVSLADLRIEMQWDELTEEVAFAKIRDAAIVPQVSEVAYRQDDSVTGGLSKHFEIPDSEETSNQSSSRPRAAGTTTSDPKRPVFPETFASRRLRFRVSFATERIARAALEGMVDFKNQSWQVSVDGEHVILDDDYLELVPPELAGQLEALQSFDGELNLRGTTQGTFAMTELPRFRFEGDVKKGHISDTRLPYPLDNVEARFAVDNSAFQLWDVTAQFGTGRVAINCEGGWLGSNGEPLSVHITGERIRLDDSVTDSVPDFLRKIWFDYSPVGFVDVDLKLTHVEGEWRADLKMQLIDISIVARGFPYRVDSCQGSVTWKRGVCTIDCRGLASGRVVTCKGTVNIDRDQPMQVDINLPRPIPIDEKLMQALEVMPNLQSTIRSFRPTGMMTCHAVLRRSPTNRKIRLDALEIEASDGSIEFDKVPYPVNGISGRIIYQNGIVSLQDFRGQNDGGTILLAGTVDSIGRLELKLTGSAIQMEEELRLSLPPGLQTLWLNLRPRGAIDYVQVRVNRNSKQAPVTFEVQAEKHKQNRGLTQSLSIRPVWFPQTLSDVTGAFDYRDGQVTIRDFEAYSGSALVSTDGHGEVTNEGWKTTFENLSIDALVLDDQFLQAMPPVLATALRKLELAGNINVFGTLVLSTGEQRTTPIDAGLGQVWTQDGDKRSLPLGGLELPRDGISARDLAVDWDVRLDMDDGSMKLAKPMQHIFGGVRLIGRQDESGTHQVGYVDVDSLVVEGVQLTQVRGPIRIDPTFVALGRSAKLAVLGTAPQPLTAELFDGRISLDARMALDDRGDFQVYGFFEDGDLTRAAAELAPRLANIRGVANGALQLTGNSLGPESYSGKGYLRLRDAQIYEIPLVLSLLKVLSIKQPDNTAFTECNFDFTIADEHFTFAPIELMGDAISLSGNGEIAFDSELDLMFYAMVGRNNVKIPVISRLAGAASQSAWQVEVDGTLQDPILKQHPFPGLNDTLQQIFPETPMDPANPRDARPVGANRSTQRAYAR